MPVYLVSMVEELHTELSIRADSAQAAIDLSGEYLSPPRWINAEQASAEVIKELPDDTEADND